MFGDWGGIELLHIKFKDALPLRAVPITAILQYRSSTCPWGRPQISETSI